jgi:hypothetical protein
MKTSKIKNVGNVKEWNSGKGTIYYHNLEMENGDKINIGKMKQQQVGWELTYEIIEEGQHEFNKAKAVAPDNFRANTSSSFKSNDDRQKKIDRWAGLGRAIDYLHGTKPTEEQLYKQAEKFIDWVNDEPKQTSVKTHFDEMDKAIKDLPF